MPPKRSQLPVYFNLKETWLAGRKLVCITFTSKLSPMADTWIVNMQHYLNEEGAIASAAGPARKLAEYFGTIVTFATAFDDDEPFLQSNIQCRRRPGRKRCEGKIQALLDFETDHIVWQCPVCGDNGAISGWEGTIWEAS